MENDKQETAKHTAEIDALLEEHKQQIAQKQEEIRLADAAGYKRESMRWLPNSKGERLLKIKFLKRLIHLWFRKDSGPPEMNELDMMAVSQQKKISDIGAPSTIVALIVSLECYFFHSVRIEVQPVVYLPFGRTKKKQPVSECKAHGKVTC